MINHPKMIAIYAKELLVEDTILETLITASQNKRIALFGVVESVVTQVTPQNQAKGFTSPTVSVVYWNCSTGEHEPIEYPEWFKLDILRFSEQVEE